MEYVCAAIIYEGTKQKNDDVIKGVQITQEKLDEISSHKKYKCLLAPIIVNKCNGAIIIAQYTFCTDDIAVRSIIDLWSECSDGFVDKYAKHIKSLSGENAVKYILESSAGIHSVIYGDTQVTSQILIALCKYKTEYNSLIEIIKECDARVITETKIKSGNTSLERIIAQCVSEKGIKKIALFGYGMSGQLIAKALIEHDIDVDVYNRSYVKPINHLYYHQYSELDQINNKIDCILALPNNDETKDLIEKWHNIFQNIYDNSSPSISAQLGLDKTNCLAIDDFAKISEQTSQKRKSERTKVDKIINEIIHEMQLHDLKGYASTLDIRDKEFLIPIVIVKDKILKLIRRFLDRYEFIEVTTPSLLKMWTENSNTSFDLIVEKNKCFLRQSQQLALQILCSKDINKVFEIGQVWRKKENRFKDMLEFTLLHCEWHMKHFNEVITLCQDLTKEILDFDYGVTNPPIRHSIIPVFSYADVVQIMKHYEIELMYGSELAKEHTDFLGRYIFKTYDSECYIIKKYPENMAKFYHLIDDDGSVNMFDLFIRSIKVASGGQRSTNKNDILHRLTYYKDYTGHDSYLNIVDGKQTHGGFSFCVDRMIIVLLDLLTSNDVKLFQEIQP